MAKRISIEESDPQFYEKSMSFIRESLEGLKISHKNVLKTELLAEECLVGMKEHATPSAVLNVKIGSYSGDAKIDMSMRGEEFDPDVSVTGSSDASLDNESEQAIRAIFIKALGENLKYSNKRRRLLGILRKHIISISTI